MKKLNRTVIDVLGIGFGPSNLATAIALVEAEVSNAIFLEKQPAFSWHPEMNLKEANLQNSFLKDLITLKNPKSQFTFLNYLREHDRIEDFVNRRNCFPTRQETTDYMFWAARHFSQHVLYNTEVIQLFLEGTDRIGVAYRDLMTNTTACYSCASLILGIGAQPFIPIEVPSHPHITHTAEMCSWLESHHFATDTQETFLIVGGGQSSAEVLYHLLTTYPRAKIQVVSRRYIYKSLEESAFINNLFSENGMNWFSSATESAQKEIFKDLYEANFSAVDNSLITKIYELLYEEKWQGCHRVQFHHYCEINALVERDGLFQVSVWDRGHEKPKYVEARHVIFATGYRYTNVASFLEPFHEFLNLDLSGMPIRNDDYSLKTIPQFKPKIFAHAIGDCKFGFTEGGMTNLAARASRIASAIQPVGLLTV